MAFARNLAWIIGIDAYSGGISPLQTAVGDAVAVADALTRLHDYDVTLVTDADATGEALTTLFTETLPGTVGEDDRLLVYFAGHGIAQDGDDGPEGFLVPVDARGDDRSTLVSMVTVQRALDGLPCRHLLLVLDCCFSGSFRWASTRSFLPTQGPLTRKRYQRFLEDPAWQVLTSSADDQKALDVLDGLTIGARPVDGEHSPFAAAFLDGLQGGADRPGADGEHDGVVTAAELYGHVRDVVELGAEQQGKTQTPGLWPLPNHGRGEFLFTVPGKEPNLRPDPVLDEGANPWRGLAAYEADDANLFFGRQRVVEALRSRLLEEDATFVAVMGASGTGKSSVVKAGLLPSLGDRFEIVGPLRPGRDPNGLLATLRARLTAPSDTERLVVIDQFEEVWTMCRDRGERERFLDGLTADLAGADGWRLLITARSDFGPQLANSPLGAAWEEARFVVPGFLPEELRDIVTGPAQVRVLYFEPPGLVDALVNEVVGVPGGLPLLSFTLAELYREYIRRQADDRALLQADYDALGGVAGALRTRASDLHDRFDAPHRAGLRQLMLRSVATDGGELARRRVFTDEVEAIPDGPDVAAAFVSARLFVSGSVGEGEEARSFVEPAHDMLVIAWDLVHAWVDEAGGQLPVLREVWEATSTWLGLRGRSPGAIAYLWHQDPRLDGAARLLDAPALLTPAEREFLEESLRHRRRNTMLVRAFFAAFVLVILAGAAGSFFYATQATQRAAEAKQEATRARDTARVVLAQQQVGQPEVGIALLREADPRTPGWMRAATTLTNPATPMMTIRLPPSHRDAVDEVRFGAGPRIYLASGGRWIAWSPRERNQLEPIDAPPADARPGLAPGTRPLPAGLWEEPNGWRRLAPSGEICGGGGQHAAPDGGWIVDTTDRGRVILLKTECRAARPDVVARIAYDGEVRDWTLAVDGRLYVGFEHQVVVLDPATLDELARYTPENPPPEEVWANFDTEGLDGARFRDAGPGGELDHQLPVFTDQPLLPNLRCESVAWSEDHRSIALACWRGYVMRAAGALPVADLNTLAVDRSFRDDDGDVRRVRLDADGSHLLSLTSEGILSIRRVAEDAAPLQLQTLADEIAYLEDDGRRVVMMDTRRGIVELLDGDSDRMLERLWARTWTCLTMEQRAAFGLGADPDADALDAACWENARR